ncbi:MAG: glycoside hydrolase family 15 protein [Leeuwenhoekiella sp.]
MKKNTEYPNIGDYGIIGNCKTSALVHKEGSIDFFCYPRFDSPSIFARLLDVKKGGSLHTRPLIDTQRITQDYLLNTNVLLTRFFSEENTVDIIDFMPMGGKGDDNELVRVVKSIRGACDLELDVDFALNYAQSEAVYEPISDQTICISTKDDAVDKLSLRSNHKLVDGDGKMISKFHLEEEEVFIYRIGGYYEEQNISQQRKSFQESISEKLETTVEYWRNWIKKCNYSGDYRDAVHRSALFLKLSTSAEHGSTVAAPTFSLPEKLGGSKNWDYRFTWVRDAAFTMYAFMRLGFLEEASQFVKWIFDRIKDDVNGHVDLQVMYTIDGSQELEEKELDLDGYEGSKPVRIGNAATEQIQLDIFGELMDTIYLFDKYGEPVTYSFWKRMEKLIDFVCKNWNSKDHGIWEVREFKEHYLYSRVMCWVALDRAVRLVKKRSFPTDLDRWIKNRNEIYNDIHENFWDEDLQSFVHFKGAKTVDSSLFLMPLVRFISPYDDRWVKTLKVIETQLVSDVLVYRNMGDEIPKDNVEEGTFLIGAFWYIECLSRGGQLEKASYYFQKLMGYANHLGLFAEEMDLTGRHLGNFPQAFTHLGLISTAFSLDRRQSHNSFVITTNYDIF